jgi:hypothetical protein
MLAVTVVFSGIAAGLAGAVGALMQGAGALDAVAAYLVGSVGFGLAAAALFLAARAASPR